MKISLRAAIVTASIAFGSIALVPVAAFAQTPTTTQVRMRDAVSLATDVYLPAGPAGTRYPTVLRRTPYDRTTNPDFGRNFAAAGYAFVSQDVRGRNASPGRFLPFFDDARDGPDTIAWIAAQPWSNGRVGTFGASAEGIVQLMAMPDAPMALRCAYPSVATDDMYEALLPGGAWRTDLTTNWLVGLMAPTALADFRAHEASDTYWDSSRVDAAERSRVHSATLLVGGFYDIFSIGTPRTHRLLRQQAAAAVRNDQFLVFGPWTHGGVGATVQGEVTYDTTAQYPAGITDLVAFFDWCLKAGPRPSFPPVRYYVSRFADTGTTATGEWRMAETWPPAATPTTMYLHASRELRGEGPAATGASAAIGVNPSAPVPSNGGGNLTTLAGPRDQAVIDARPDVIFAQTSVASAPVEIIGDVRATIWASSATDDVDVIVRVSDVTPSGKVLLISDGARRGRFVQGFDRIRPLVAGAATPFEVEIGPMAIVLPVGHALRVSISGTSSPRYEANPNVAVSLGSNPTPRATTLTLFRDTAHPSAVILPVALGTLPGSVPAVTDAGVDAALNDSGAAVADANVDATGSDSNADVLAADAGTRMTGGCACTTRPVPRAASGLVNVGVAVALAGLRSRARRRLRRRHSRKSDGRPSR